jgi:hypothetical protein
MSSTCILERSTRNAVYDNDQGLSLLENQKERNKEEEEEKEKYSQII